jgi:hypothetical protein
MVLDARPSDDASVVGDECHIVSPKEHGPRFDASVPENQVDDPTNLVLLCRVHHKMVDDQCETYTVEILRLLKANHEKWVSSMLTEQKPVSAVRIRRIKENVPTHLVRLTSGRDILTVVDGANAFAFEHDELNSPTEVELVSGFLQQGRKGDKSNYCNFVAGWNSLAGCRVSLGLPQAMSSSMYSIEATHGRRSLREIRITEELLSAFSLRQQEQNWSEFSVMRIGKHRSRRV